MVSPIYDFDFLSIFISVSWLTIRIYIYFYYSQLYFILFVAEIGFPKTNTFNIWWKLSQNPALYFKYTMN